MAKNVKIIDSLMAMEERKQSVGLYESEGVIDSQEQVRTMWVSMDLDVEELATAVSDILGPVMMSCMHGMNNGISPHLIFHALYCDAFANGVLYEQARNPNGIAA